jgi:hypothetical protein
MYQQIPPTRDVQASNFPNSNIIFPYFAGNSWNPKDSYFRMRIKITKADGSTPLECSDDIAPNMDIAANLFTNIRFKINGTEVDSVCDYLPQICALKTRSENSKYNLDGVLSSTMWFQYDQRERLRKIVSDGAPKSDRACSGVGIARADLGFDAAGGNNTVALAANGVVTFAQGNAATPLPVPFPFKVGDYYVDTTAADQPLRLVTKIIASDAVNASMQTYPNLTTANGAATRDFLRVPGSSVPSYQRGNIELIWRPPLEILNVEEMPAGKYEFIFTPHPRSNIYNMGIETISTNKVQDTDFKMSVQDMYYYVYQYPDKGFLVPEVTYNYNNIKCRAEDITAGGGLQQKSFAIDGPISALAIAFQDQNYSSDTRRSASKFKVRPEGGVEDLGLTLQRLYVQGPGNVKKPQPDSDPSFVSPDDYMTQRYFETLMHTGQIMNGEDITDFLERGPFYYFNWNDAEQGEHDYKAQVYYSFDSNLQDKANVLFFYKKIKQIKLFLEDGAVQGVEVIN